MDCFKPTFGIEPTNKYDKAKQDVTKAIVSVRALEPWQREQLAKELLGADILIALHGIMQQYFE